MTIAGGRKLGGAVSSAAGASLPDAVLAATLPSAFFALDEGWRFSHVNEATEWLLGRGADELLGRRIWDVFPEAAGADVQRHYEEAVREQHPVTFRTYYARMAQWLFVQACPMPGGLAVYFDEADAPPPAEEEADATIRELRRQLALERGLARMARRLAAGPGAQELYELTCATALEVTGGDAAWVSRLEGEHVRVLAAASGIPQLLPTPGERFPVAVDDDLRHAIAAGDAVSVGRGAPGPAGSRLLAAGLRAGCYLPVGVDGGRWGVLCVACVAAREDEDGLRDSARGVVDLLAEELSRRARAMHGVRGGSAQGTSAVWRGALDSLVRHVAIIDASGRIVAVNEAWARFAQAQGADPEPSGAGTGVGANYLDVCRVAAAGGDADAGAVAEGLQELLAGREEAFRFEYPCHTGTEQRWFALNATPVPEAGQRHVVVEHEDVTGRRKLEQLARRQAELLDEIDAAVICTDLDGVVTLWNDAAATLYGWRPEEVLGRPMTDLGPGEEDRGAVREMLALLHEQGKWEGERVVRDRSGRSFTCAMRNSLVSDEDGEPVGIIGVSFDVTERDAHRRDLEAAGEYLRAITASIADGLLALNDDGLVIYGNAAAAKLLRRSAGSLVGEHVSAVVGREAGELAAMVGGDPLVRVPEDHFVGADGRRLTVAWTASALKGGPQGEGRVVVFRDITAERHERERRRKEAERLRWTARIRDATRENRFELFAQPIIELADDSVTGHELLLRLHGEDGELIAPAGFLPSAEEHGLMAVVDRWVLRRGFQLAATGRRVHVNLSAQSIGDAELLDEVDRCLGDHPGASGRMTLELTETALTEDWDTAITFTRALAECGFRLALDDFGTGYNAFANLKAMAVDEIKIDQSFVQDLLRAPASESVVRAVVHLARDLGMRTVAEGVEDAETLARLRVLGVDFVQGFHLGRPAPLD